MAHPEAMARRHRFATGAYAALAALDTALAGSRHPRARAARTLSKTALMPTLAASLLLDPRVRDALHPRVRDADARDARDADVREADARGAASREGRRRICGVLVGLLGSWLGDVALLREEPVRVAVGAGCFAAAHAAYLGSVGTLRRLPLVGAWPRSAQAYGGLALVVTPWAVRGAARESAVLAGVVAAYAGVVTALVAGCGLAGRDDRSALGGDPTIGSGRRLTQIGGLLFGVSDALLGVGMFIQPRDTVIEPCDVVIEARDARRPAVRDAAVMATYTAAQLCLVEGARRAARSAPQGGRGH